MQTPASGTTVGGKYRILRVLGQGGMGAVFEAENTLTLKRAAIKWLHPRHIGRESSRARLLQEARATSRIRHRNVVDLYDVVEEDEAIFLVMELLTGELLSQRIARGSMPLYELIALLLQAMEGVAAGHDVGVVHRDVKPDNIFLAAGPTGVVPKIIDFGISKVADPDFARLTRSGIAIGTPRYASFEQVRGERDVDGRSDVYAFGVILYEALVGRGPYNASTFGEQAVQFITAPPLPPRSLRPEVPLELDAIVQRALARDREERFATMLALIEALTPYARAAHYPVALSALRAGDDLELPGTARRGEETQPAARVSALVAPSAPPAPGSATGPRWLLASSLAIATVLAFAAAKSGRSEPSDASLAASVAARVPSLPDLPERRLSLASGALDAGEPFVLEADAAPLAAPVEPNREQARGRRRIPSVARPKPSAPTDPALQLLTTEPTQASAPSAEEEPERLPVPARAGAVRRDEF